MTAARQLKIVKNEKTERPAPRLSLVQTGGFSRRHATHQYAENHVLSMALKRYGNMARREKLAKIYEASGVLACRRIREFAHDVGTEYKFEFGWQVIAAERCGLSYSTMWAIIHEKVTSVSPKTVDAVVLCSGIPARLFYDAEE